MKHLEEEELIEMYYGEGSGPADAHVKACRQCSAQYARLKQSMDAIQPAPVPQRSADYGERVWQNLRPQLIPYEPKLGWRPWMHWKLAAAVVGCAVVLAIAFLGGRYWERGSIKQSNVTANNQARQRVVFVVLTDHLDRTERLLTELNHADAPDQIQNAQLQLEARKLLASNRLYRVSATNSGDVALAGALDRLQGVLAEIANDPNLTSADLRRVRTQMNTEGMLFEIRVLLARSPDQGTKGASI